MGPLTGATPPAARQKLIDAFTAAPPGAVLISQISAGGIGLNIQAASVIIVCEPQFKPSSENQAIARARRMGQLRAVQVHRLLSLDSIDQRVVQILAEKQAVFDHYAHPSDLAAASGDAIDPRVALRLVSDERTRLGIATPAST
jgi:SNF2 family DNA or RNA helicase